jgi:hypothetical protein
MDSATAHPEDIFYLDADGKPPNENFNEWKQWYFDLAAKTDLRNNPRLGSLGMLMTAQEYTAINNGNPYQVLAEPAVPAANNALAVTIYKQEYDNWQHQQAQHALLPPIGIKSLGKFKKLIAAPFPVGFRNLTPRDIYEFVNQRYGAMAPTQMSAKSDSLLDHPFNPLEMTLEEYFGKHQEAANALAEIGQPMSQMARVAKLSKGVAGCGLYNDALLQFNTNPATMTTRDQNFENLSALLRIFENVRDKALVPPTTTYAHAAAQQARGRDGKRPTSPNRKRSQSPAQFNGKHYCWSHGFGNHLSSECRNPKQGHVSKDFKLNPIHL